MEEFKSPIERLARLFRKGRDDWREKAIERQKEIRGLEIKIRDLLKSRENWKERALTAELKLKQHKRGEDSSQKKEEEKSEAVNLGIDVESEELNVKRHHYKIQTIQQALELVIDCGISFRGTEKVFELFQYWTKQTAPSFSSIRQWLGRIGIYELRRDKEYRNDWIFIIDFTLELGKQKALVVLGVTQQHLFEKVINKKRGLSHEDVEVLEIEIMNSTKGEMIDETLEKISKKVGVPVQIVADNGSDIARGIKLYQQKNPELIYTHDVTHAMALLLKYQLDSDDRYQSFIQKCTICRQRLQQTELYFLAPPAQRSQCRYFNVERLTDWGIKLLKSPKDTMIKLIPEVEPLVSIKKIEEKLGWLADYELDLLRWNQMVSLTREAERKLKESGMNDKTLGNFEKDKFVFTDSYLNSFQQNIIDYIAIQCEKIKNQSTFLASSDVIESLFGKYKHFSARCPFKEMGQMLLTICLSTMNLTASIIKNALETISFSDVEAWFDEVFGQSMLSKRKTLFSIDSDMKTV
jgi:hypothetical protein